MDERALSQKTFINIIVRTIMSSPTQPTSLPETGFLRLSQIIGAPNAVPPIPPLIPVARSTWWAGVRSGLFPRPIKIGPRITVWRVEDIRQLIRETTDNQQ